MTPSPRLRLAAVGSALVDLPACGRGRVVLDRRPVPAIAARRSASRGPVAHRRFRPALAPGAGRPRPGGRATPRPLHAGRGQGGDRGCSSARNRDLRCDPGARIGSHSRTRRRTPSTTPSVGFLPALAGIDTLQPGDRLLLQRSGLEGLPGIEVFGPRDVLVDPVAVGETPGVSVDAGLAPAAEQLIPLQEWALQRGRPGLRSRGPPARARGFAWCRPPGPG